MLSPHLTDELSYIFPRDRGSVRLLWFHPNRFEEVKPLSIAFYGFAVDIGLISVLCLIKTLRTDLDASMAMDFVRPLF